MDALFQKRYWFVMRSVPVGNFEIGDKQPLALIVGPCVIENEDHALRSAEAILSIAKEYPINLIYKSSYDKANRSAGDAYRGPGLEKGLRILEKVKRKFQIPVLTDVHSVPEAQAAAQVCDIIQIPAFLCRQTDLILAAAQTGAVINVKKGQFLAPWDMKNVVQKIVSTGNQKIILTERGASFGYNQLVADMRSIPIMQSLGYPVCFDAGHAVQKPGGLGNASGGDREFIPLLAKAAVAAGCNAIFVEAHQNPAEGYSDKESMLPFSELSALINTLCRLYEVVQKG